MGIAWLEGILRGRPGFGLTKAGVAGPASDGKDWAGKGKGRAGPGGKGEGGIGPESTGAGERREFRLAGSGAPGD
jgi:hypothetical protein